MLIPLYLVELDRPSLSNTIFLIQNSDRIFGISQIWFKFHSFNLNILLRHSETLLQLRNMEHIMHSCEMFSKFQAICHFSIPLQNLIWSNVSGCQLSFNTKTVNSLHWWYFQIYKISFGKYQWSPPPIRITLLVGLSYLQITLYLPNLVFCFFSQGQLQSIFFLQAPTNSTMFCIYDHRVLQMEPF